MSDVERGQRTLLVVGDRVERIPGDRDCVLILRKGMVTEQRVLLDSVDEP